MKRFVFACVFAKVALFAGSWFGTSFAGDPKDKVKDAKFNPTDFASTESWAKDFVAGRKTKNEIKLKRERESINKDLKGFVGKEVKWKVPVKSISEKNVALQTRWSLPTGETYPYSLEFYERAGKPVHEEYLVLTLRFKGKDEAKKDAAKGKDDSKSKDASKAKEKGKDDAKKDDAKAKEDAPKNKIDVARLGGDGSGRRTLLAVGTDIPLERAAQLEPGDGLALRGKIVELEVLPTKKLRVVIEDVVLE